MKIEELSSTALAGRIRQRLIREGRRKDLEWLGAAPPTPWDNYRSHPNLPPPWQAQSILIQRQFGLGDVIFALSVAEELARRNPSARLGFVTKPSFTEWVQWFPFLDHVYDETPQEPYEVYIDLQDIPVADGEDRIAVMARKVGLTVSSFVTAPPIPLAALTAVQQRLLRPFRKGNFWLLAPFASGHSPARSWPLEEVEKFCALAAKQGRVVIVDSQPLPEIPGSDRVLNLCGETSVTESLVLVHLCQRFVGMDSGLLYAAAMFRRPAVGLFSHIDPASRLGCAERVVVIHPVGLDCVPCGDFDYLPPCAPTSHRRACLQPLRAEMVWPAARNVHSNQKKVVTVPLQAATKEGGSSRPLLWLIVPWFIAGGGERHLQLLCQGLARDHGLYLVETYPERPGHFRPRFWPWLAAQLTAPTPRQKAQQLAALLEQARPPIVGFYNNPITLEALQGITHRPRCVFAIVHTQLPHELNIARHEARGLIDWFVCVSEAVREYLLRESDVPAERVVVIPNGVDPTPFQSAAEVREELGFRPRDFVVGSIGRIAAGKNVDLTIRAIAALPPLVKGLFVGWGEDVPACQRLVQELRLERRVKILGVQTEVAPFYKALDAFVLPSDTEGAIPYAVLEAIAAGVPVVVTNVSDVGRAFTDRRHVLLIQKSVPSIVSAIQWLRSDARRRERLVDEAQRLLYDRFSAEHMVEKYRRLWEANDGHGEPVHDDEG